MESNESRPENSNVITSFTKEEQKELEQDVIRKTRDGIKANDLWLADSLCNNFRLGITVGCIT